MPKPIARRLRGFWIALRLAFRVSPWRSLLSLLTTVLGGIGFPLSAVGMKLIVDGAQLRSTSTIAEGAVLTSIGLAGGLGAILASAVVSFGLTVRVNHEITRTLNRLVASLPGLEHFERPEYADRLQLVREQRSQLVQPAAPIFQGIAMVAGLGGSIALAVRVAPILGLIPLAGVPMIVAGSLAETWHQRSLKRTAEARRLGTHLLQLGTSRDAAKELRIYGLNDEILSRYRAAEKERLDVESRNLAFQLLVFVPGLLLSGLGYGGAVVYTAHLAAIGHAHAGDVFLMVMLVTSIVSQTLQTLNAVQSLVRLLAVSERLGWLDEFAAETPLRSGRVTVPERLVEGIELRGVEFVYPGAEEPSLSEVSLVLPAGGTVALVGENGAGKTSLVKLLARFYDPTEGTIGVDGTPLRELDLESWRSRVAAGFQDFVRYELLAGETVGVGDVARVESPAAVLTALERAGALELVEDLPTGLETQLGRSFPAGVDLSGGQWQKLALGRAMMRDLPLLLLLDEPTASLDAASEHALFERYASAARRLGELAGTVTLLVSHRFSTVRMADLIVVFAHGRVVEQGTHEELLARGGSYAEMFGLQARAYAPAEPALELLDAN